MDRKNKLPTNRAVQCKIYFKLCYKKSKYIKTQGFGYRGFHQLKQFDQRKVFTGWSLDTNNK